MILFLLAVTGTALILTQSSIFESLRVFLSNVYENELSHFKATDQSFGNVGLSDFDFAEFNRRKRRVAVTGLIAKLASCPMCAGFWIGLAWGTAMFDPTFGAAMFVYGPAGSIASAIGVALWLLLVEAHGALALWRYINQPKD